MHLAERADVAEREYLEAREDIAQRTSNLFFELYAARATLANAQLTAAAVRYALPTERRSSGS